MINEVPSLSRLIAQLPTKLQTRFESLNNYVQGLIEELKIELKLEHKLSNDEIRLIQFAVFVFSIDDFFRLGTRAAQGASLTFRKFDLPGFRVGATIFTQDNENTMRGLNIAEKLREAVSNTDLEQYLAQARTIRGLVTRLLEVLNDR